MTASDMFRLSEAIRGEDYLLATYYIEMPAEADILAKAASYAVGQTIGTWVEVPGVTAEMRDRHLGRVVKVLEAPPVDLGTQTQETSGYFMQIALPTVNIGPSIPMLLATAIGNDVSTSVQAKLVDLEVPDTLAEELVGPRFGIEGVRKLVGVNDRPLVLNMIKPCTGLTPEAGAQIFYETALGGVDLIKDDELMGNPSFSPVVDRVKAYLAAGERARDETGRDVVYLPNVTDRADRMLDTARRAVDAGARAVMCAYASVGYGGLQSLSEIVGVPILAHYAAAGPYFEGPGTGMSAPIALGLLPRLAGGDLAITITPYGGYPLRRLQYLKMIQQLTLPRPHIAPTFPVIGGGVHPGTVETYMGELGPDIVLGAGGAIQGHPDGAAAGADAMRQAIDAVMAGQRVVDAAQEHPELPGRWRSSARPSDPRFTQRDTTCEPDLGYVTSEMHDGAPAVSCRGPRQPSVIDDEECPHGRHAAHRGRERLCGDPVQGRTCRSAAQRRPRVGGHRRRARHRRRHALPAHRGGGGPSDHGRQGRPRTARVRDRPGRGDQREQGSGDPRGHGARQLLRRARGAEQRRPGALHGRAGGRARGGARLTREWVGYRFDPSSASAEKVAAIGEYERTHEEPPISEDEAALLADAAVRV